VVPYVDQAKRLKSQKKLKCLVEKLRLDSGDEGIALGIRGQERSEGEDGLYL
jgi:hypothetical protein